MRSDKSKDEYDPLFETKQAKGRLLYRLFAATVFVSVCLIWTYRVNYLAKAGSQNGRWVWFGMLAAELWFSLYWVITQTPRWNPVYRSTFKDRLSKRFKNELPGVDIFVCTADPAIEPPLMVINTVLSVMAYDYPPENLGVYLSDDAGSDLTFYALLEASKFAEDWVPYCKKFNVEPRCPAAYFLSKPETDQETKEFVAIKKIYAEMEDRIETATKIGRIPEETRLKHKGFSQWDSSSSKRDHDTILQILVDGKNPNATTSTDGGYALPTLVYMAREKRPRHFHNFKAGAVNALIRVSSKITNGPIILILDCDMYSNNSSAVRDALCFFMDEQQTNNIAFVQFRQHCVNVTENDLYGGSLQVISQLEFHGIDAYGGPLYIGSGCFHRRDTLCGKKFTDEDCKNIDWKRDNNNLKKQPSVRKLEEETKPLASCTYDQQNPQWGKEMGMKYGCPVEDVITGLSIQCNGWKSVYCNPEREAFQGLAPTTLPQTLVQHKRWSEGNFQILLSKYSPVWYAYGRIRLGLQLCYCRFGLWAPNCLATLYYSIIPSLCLLKGTLLFPQVSSPWILPFAYVIFAMYMYSLVEFVWCGGTVLGWWNEQRIWLYKRTSSYPFALIDTILKLMGFNETSFVITAKVEEDDVLRRYKKEVMEFGVSSQMLIILATLAMLNLFCLFGVVKKVVVDEGFVSVYETMILQILLCCVLVLINWPLYQGLFLRTDKGKVPISVTIKSFLLALFVCFTFNFLY